MNGYDKSDQNGLVTMDVGTIREATLKNNLENEDEFEGFMRPLN